MKLTEVTSPLITHFLHAFFAKFTVLVDTTELSEACVRHYGVSDFTKAEMKLFKLRLRNQLKYMVEARIIIKEKHESVLKTVRYKYKANKDVWKQRNAD